MTPKKRETRHIPVMLHAVCSALRLPAPPAPAAPILESGRGAKKNKPAPKSKTRQAPFNIIDCTLGLAGHSSEFLRRLGPRANLLALDMDTTSIAIARARLTAASHETGGKFHIVHRNFAALQSAMLETGIDKAHALLADLGVSSPQIDDPARGFSYKRPGPLDMRMDPTRGQPASQLLARLSEKEIAAALLELGDETDAPQIARLIVKRREHEPITTTHQLMAIVCEARDFTLLRAAGAKLHPAARTFQALRILVNRELDNLHRLLTILPDVLAPGGIAALISFHSGEDRRVKAAFKTGHLAGIYSEISEDLILASPEEILQNPRSRSAKLRWAKRSET